MKQPYIRRKHSGDIVDRYSWHPVRLTGLCKTVTGGLSGIEHKYYQVRATLFKIPLWTYWVHAAHIKFYDPVVETIYKCECNK